MANPLQQAGSQGSKPSFFAPIYTARFLTGLWLQRSPLRDPSTRVEAYYGGRPEALISGVNIELTNALTLARRPGTSAYSLQTVSEAVNSFYSFRTFTTMSETIQVMMDGITKIYTVTPAAVTTVFTKANGAGQASFLGINNALYMGDGVEQKAWSGSGSFRNWGIAPGGITLTSAYAGTGASNSPSGGAATQGPSATGTGANSAIAGPTGSEIWATPTNIQALDGAYAASTMIATDDGVGGIIQDGTQYINATNFGFTVPAGATITGVAAAIYKMDGTNTATYPGFIKDDAVYLIKAGTIQTGWTNKADASAWPIGYVAATSYGGSADVWGSGGLTVADVNNSGFGVALAAKTSVTVLNSHTDNNVRLADTDYISVTIYYTTPVTASWTTPANIVGAPASTFTTAIPVSSTQTAALLATNYGFGVSGTITGVQVDINGKVSAAAGDNTLYVQLQDNNGNSIGIQKSVPFNSTGAVTVSFGSSTDLWGAPLSTTIINNTNFGAQIIVSGSGVTFSLDSCRIWVSTSAVTATVSGSAGTFTAVTGYQYVYEYSDGGVYPPVFSNSTAATATTGAFTNKLNVGVGVTASTDTQVNQIWVFRTKDGGATFYSLPSNPYPNTTGTITDNAADSTLITTQLAATALQNTPPPVGIGGMVYHMGRLWGFVGNVLYYATGTDLGNILGNPYESWGPANYFTLPAKISKLVSTEVGLIIFTTSDVWIVRGNGSATAASSGVSGITVFYVSPFITNLGVDSQFAVDVNGTTIYVYTAEKNFISIDPNSGISKIGFPIAAPNIAYPSDPALNGYNPSSAYVAWHMAGQEEAIFVADGSTGWFRCNPSQAPEGGFVWSPKANITGGCQAVQSIEVTPGIHYLLIGPTTGGGKIQYRNLSVNSDVGVAYPANFIMGSIVLAYPGQMAELGFLTCDFNRVGTSPVLSLLLDEISGTFTNISGYVHSDPPLLYGPTSAPATVYANRYDLKQSVSGGSPPPTWCRHLQISVDFGSSDGVQNELLSMTIFGCHHQES